MVKEKLESIATRVAEKLQKQIDQSELFRKAADKHAIVPESKKGEETGTKANDGGEDDAKDEEDSETATGALGHQTQLAFGENKKTT